MNRYDKQIFLINRTPKNAPLFLPEPPQVELGMDGVKMPAKEHPKPAKPAYAQKPAAQTKTTEPRPWPRQRQKARLLKIISIPLRGINRQIGK